MVLKIAIKYGGRVLWYPMEGTKACTLFWIRKTIMEFTKGERYQVTSTAIDLLKDKYPPFLFVVEVDEVDHARDHISFNLVRSEHQETLHDLRCIVEGCEGSTLARPDPFEKESAFAYWLDKGTVQPYR